MTIIEGATNPEIKNGTRYEYCTFEKLVLDRIVFDDVTFYNCDFIECSFELVCWYKCDFLTCFIHATNVRNCTFARCKVDMFIGYSTIIDNLFLESELKLTNQQSIIKFLY